MLIGALSAGWLYPIYLYLVDYLYLSISLAPKVQYCRSLIDTDFCKLVAYIGLWVSEFPLLLVGFFTYYYLVVAIIRKYRFVLPNWYGVWFGYFVVSTILVFSEYKFSVFGVLCSVYQALVGACMLSVALRLTSCPSLLRQSCWLRGTR